MFGRFHATLYQRGGDCQGNNPEYTIRAGDFGARNERNLLRYMGLRRFAPMLPPPYGGAALVPAPIWGRSESGFLLS